MEAKEERSRATRNILSIMEIKTKYNIGEEVWCLVKGKPYKATITVYKIDGYNIICGLIDDICRCFELSEYNLFPTKEELIKSL